jgi:hypothetical protein
VGAILRFLIALVLGGALGVGSAAYMLKHGAGLGAVDAQGWRTSISTGSAAADPYTRAVVAARGLLALTRDEAVYYTRNTDESGAPLREACVYRIGGASLPARWWSVTAYATDDFLPQNDDDALSFGSAYAGDGGWSVTLSVERPTEGAWISTRSAGDGLSVMLRLYQPEAVLMAAPRIERVSCP